MSLSGQCRPVENFHSSWSVSLVAAYTVSRPEPRFSARFQVESQRVVAERHVKATLVLDGRRFSAIRFGSAQPLPATIEAVYRLDVDSYQGEDSVQLTLEFIG